MDEKITVELLFDALTEKYDETDVLTMIDELITEGYSDFDPEEFNDEFENYYETGNNEIPMEVLEDLIRVESEKQGIDVESDAEYDDLVNMLCDEWNIDL